MFKTIETNTTFEIVEKKSKFIANLIYVETKAEAEILIKENKKKYHDARHNCYAYRILEEGTVLEKSSDDRRAIRNCRGSNVKYITKKWFM